MISEEKRIGDLHFLEISEIGANHEALFLPNQDAISSFCIDDDFVIAVADGVGSCRKAEMGSTAAVEACVTIFKDLISQKVSFESTIMAKAIIAQWKAILIGVEIDECCTTLKAVFKMGNTLKVVSIGDGFVAVSSNGIKLLSPAEDSTFTNETNCLNSRTEEADFWIGDFHLDLYMPYAIVCCTDGIANGLVAGSELDFVEEIEKRSIPSQLKSDVEELVIDISNYCFDDKTIGVVKYERKN